MFDFLLKPARRVLFAFFFAAFALFISACSDSDSGGGGTLTDAETPVITSQPQSMAYNQNAASTPLSVTAGVSDGGTLSYQWFSNMSESNEGGTLVASTETYTVPTDTVGTFYYYAVVTNTNAAVNGSQTTTTTSDVAVITVNARINAETPVISVGPASAVYTQYAAAAPLSVTAGVSDGGTLSYEWYSNTSNNNTGGTLVASTQNFAVPTDISGTFYYYAVITNTNTAVDGEQTAAETSGAAEITVNVLTNAETPVISVEPLSATYPQYASVSLSVTAGVTDGGTLSYQWYESASASASDGTLVASTETYTAPTDTVGIFYYYAVVTNTNTTVNGGQTSAATSAVAVITVNNIINAETPVVSVGPSSGTYSRYASVSLSVTANVTDGGTLSYQWYSNTSNSNTGGDLVASSETYTVPTDAVGIFYYYAVVTNTNTAVNGAQTVSAPSGAAVITVFVTNAATPLISLQPQSSAYSQNAPASLSVAANVSDGGILSYQWFSNTTNSNTGGTEIPSETSDTYTAPNDTVATSYYYAVVTNTNTAVDGSQTAAAASDVAVITVAASVTHAAYFYESGTLAHIEPVAAAQDIALRAPAAIAGWSFDGWYINNTGSAAVFPYNLTADTSFYARWTPDDPTAPKVKAVFYDDYTEVSSIEEYAVNYMTLPAATRSKYTFIGWKAESAATVKGIRLVSSDTDFNSDFELAEPFTKIYTKADLENISNYLSSSYMLMNDIDLEGINWVPIDLTVPGRFNGIFEGNGKTIRGLFIDNTNSRIGFFSGVQGGARIANLTVELTGSGIKGTQSGGIGGIAGFVTATSSLPTKIVNVHVKIQDGQAPKITGSDVGGVVGTSEAYVTIANCSNEVPVEADRMYAGGILGYTNGGASIKILKSRNTGSVTISNSSTNDAYAGGIAGDGRASITDSYNTGAVSATSANRNAYAGGIAGSSILATGNLIQNYNVGAVSAVSSGYSAYAGGIAGVSSVNTTRSYNTGDVSAAANTADSAYNAYAGGIAGQYSAAVMSENYNTGNVAGSSSSGRDVYAGGTVGQFNTSGTVSANYNTGNVSASSESGAIYAAGIVGHRSGKQVISDNAAANSSVSGTGAIKKVNRVVGYSGDADLRAITGNIALGTMAGSFENESAYLGTDKTELELKTQATYEALGWLFGNDADNPWTIASPDGTGYPRLYWE
jgi:hypothetical protein